MKRATLFILAVLLVWWGCGDERKLASTPPATKGYQIYNPETAERFPRRTTAGLIETTPIYCQLMSLDDTLYEWCYVGPIHQVAEGETLWSISRQYNLPFEVIYRAEPNRPALERYYARHCRWWPGIEINAPGWCATPESTLIPDIELVIPTEGVLVPLEVADNVL